MDKIDTIRALLLKHVEYHSKALDDLRRKLKQLDDVDAMLPTLGDTSGISLADINPKKPYQGLGLTEAVKLALIHAVTTPRTLRELRELLIRGGFEPPKTFFSETLNATLHRLAQQGFVIVGEDMDERKTFIKKEI